MRFGGARGTQPPSYINLEGGGRRRRTRRRRRKRRRRTRRRRRRRRRGKRRRRRGVLMTRWLGAGASSRSTPLATHEAVSPASNAPTAPLDPPSVT